MTRKLVFAFIIPVILFSCKQEKIKPGNIVEIYLLKSYQVVPGKCQVDTSTAILQETPFVTNQDILTYSRKTYEYTLTASAFQKVKSSNPHTAFAISVDHQVIFYGFVIPNFISSSCDHSITMDASSSSTNKIILNLGYPGQQAGITIEDKRNHPKILVTLSSQGKLR